MGQTNTRWDKNSMYVHIYTHIEPGSVGVRIFGTFYVSNNVENESLQTSVYVRLSFGAY